MPFGRPCLLQWGLMKSSKPPVEQTLTETQTAIVALGKEITEMLLAKNRKYGDSALHPTRIFSRSDVIEQLNVRIDDKLSRILSGQVDEDEDIDLDLIGYLYLRLLAKRRDKC